MTQTATITAVMKALADPTRRAVFERVAKASEISVADLTKGSGVTQGAVPLTFEIAETGRFSSLSVPRAATSFTAPSPRGWNRSSPG